MFELVLIWPNLGLNNPAFLRVHKTTRSLHSSNQNLSRLKCRLDRAFCIATLRLWNALPPSIRQAPSINIFKSRLKTFSQRHSAVRRRSEVFLFVVVCSHSSLLAGNHIDHRKLLKIVLDKFISLSLLSNCAYIRLAVRQMRELNCIGILLCICETVSLGH